MAPQPPPGAGGGRRHRRYPAPPPPPGRGGRGGGNGKGGGGGQKNPKRPNASIDLAVTDLRNALMQRGFNPQAAYNFARMALTQKGVVIGKHGNVHYKGGTYKAGQWAESPLVKYVTGEKAKAANQAKIEADPNYQQALANLSLTRDQSQAGLDAQRRQSLLDFGDSSFVSGDPVLAAAVAANPFSTSRLQQQTYQQDQRTAGQTANLAGNLFGGGYQSGQLEATHQFAGNTFQGTSALQNLLSALQLQGSQLGQNYTLGQQNALLQTQQNLAQAGTLSASGPKMHIGKFRLFKPPKITNPNRNRLSNGGAGLHRGGLPSPLGPNRPRVPLGGGLG